MNETELLFTEVLGCSRMELYLERKRKLSMESCSRISGALKRRILGEPIQYILGKTEFMGWEFKVSPEVLIPRPDTEVLVETALRYAKDKGVRDKSSELIVHSSEIKADNSRADDKGPFDCAQGRQVVSGKCPGLSDQCKVKSVKCKEVRSKIQDNRLKVLDIGTGSGCIAVSLAKGFPEMDITAVDISLAALEIARQNAQLNGVRSRIDFLNCDLFPPRPLCATEFDFIISNPPYIRTNIIRTLEMETRFEPRKALDGGADGLDFYRRILEKSPAYLKPNGLLFLEIGFDQQDSLEKILASAQIFVIKELIRDYNSINRVLVLELKNKF